MDGRACRGQSHWPCQRLCPRAGVSEPYMDIDTLIWFPRSKMGVCVNLSVDGWLLRERGVGRGE